MATDRQKNALKNFGENRGNLYQAMIRAGYSHFTARNAKYNLLKSKGAKELREKLLPEINFAIAHNELLNASRIEHMVFPLVISDEEIKQLLAEANCMVKKFQHSETQTHVWYFAADNKARKDAIDMGYKVWGTYAPEKVDHGDLGWSLSKLFDQNEKRNAKK